MINAKILNITATSIRGSSVAAYLLPTIFGFSFGGMKFGEAVNATASIMDGTASIQNQDSALSDKKSVYDRRDQEWELQKELTKFDKEQIQKQIDAQQIRIEIAEQELKIHNKSIEQAKEIEDFLKGKFTNQELYQWMIGRLSILYFQTYKVALDMAMATQSAYQYELNKDDTYINFDYWDSLKKGLLAGESLMLGLNQLEKAYIEGNVRRLEIEKTISLLELLGSEAFDSSRNNSNFVFHLTEELFDLDFPGHYCRQIKTIAVSIPAVVGPYQNINATLTQTKNETLLKPNLSAVDYLLASVEARQKLRTPEDSVLRVNWRRNQKIALSRGVNDSGLFELNFRDERYLPFEGTGAVSSWELSFPQSNKNKKFDLSSISDVIITLSYTALDGGDDFRETIESKIQ